MEEEGGYRNEVWNAARAVTRSKKKHKIETEVDNYNKEREVASEESNGDKRQRAQLRSKQEGYGVLTGKKKKEWGRPAAFNNASHNPRARKKGKLGKERCA